MKFYRPVAVASYRKLVGYQAGLLAGTCAMVAALILIGNTVTSGRIAAMEKADQLKMLNEVLPSEIYDNDLLADQLSLPLITDNPAGDSNNSTDNSGPQLSIYLAKADSKVSGMAFPVTANGYGGDIELIVGIDVQGAILGVRVVSHKETPGLGDKIEISRDQWITTFNGLSLDNTATKAWGVKKDGGQFDQFTGATITPRAIVRAVHQGLILIDEQKPAITRAVNKQALSNQSVAMASATKTISNDKKAKAAEPDNNKAIPPVSEDQNTGNVSLVVDSTTEVATSNE